MMVDNLSKEQRKKTMSLVRDKDTKPEMAVRKLAHSIGYRYRLHRRNLPGCPDLVFPCKRKVIFVHGCFWHGHDCRAGLNRPSSNENYWTKKLERNIQRDAENLRKVKELDWSALVIWECETKNSEVMTNRICGFLQ